MRSKTRSRSFCNTWEGFTGCLSSSRHRQEVSGNLEGMRMKRWLIEKERPQKTSVSLTTWETQRQLQNRWCSHSRTASLKQHAIEISLRALYGYRMMTTGWGKRPIWTEWSDKHREALFASGTAKAPEPTVWLSIVLIQFDLDQISLAVTPLGNTQRRWGKVWKSSTALEFWVFINAKVKSPEKEKAVKMQFECNDYLASFSGMEIFPSYWQ